MATLDLFYLTFNAAKNEISVPAFADHLSRAFGQNDTALPELVAFSLQEMAPLPTAFIGSYLLKPYFDRYEDALNLAADKFVADEARAPPSRERDRPYTLVVTRNVGMTGIMLFARDPAAISDMQTAEVGFGAGDMANKGAVGLRMYYKKAGEQTQLTFVSTHLAAMEWNLERRNRNWESLVSGLVFADPKKIVGADHQTRALGAPTDEDDAQPLLFHPDTERKLHDASIYRPGSHLFVAGDLNYRLSKTAPPVDAVFPVVDNAESEDYYMRFLTRDQLTSEKQAGRTLHGLSEAPIRFPPTYKYDVLPKGGPETDLARTGEEETESDNVKWKFASHRWPGWCDRVLWLNIPDWVLEQKGEAAEMQVTAYDCLPVVRSSDHRAVFLRVKVPVLSPDVLKPPPELLLPEALATHSGLVADPRIKLPAAINIDAWSHRESVKKWEELIGLSLLLSRKGVALFTTTIVVALGVWWYRSR